MKKWDDLEGFLIIFGNTHMSVLVQVHPSLILGDFFFTHLVSTT